MSLNAGQLDITPMSSNDFAPLEALELEEYCPQANNGKSEEQEVKWDVDSMDRFLSDVCDKHELDIDNEEEQAEMNVSIQQGGCENLEPDNVNISGASDTSNAIKHLYSEVRENQRKRRINIISDVKIREAEPPSLLRQHLTRKEPVKAKRVIKKKSVQPPPSAKQVLVMPEDLPRPSLPPPRPLSPVIATPGLHGLAYQRNSAKSQERAAKVNSSQPDWENNDFSESQGDAFSSAFAAHRKLVRLYTESESEVRMRQNDVEELEKKLVAARAALEQAKQAKNKHKHKLQLVCATFMFKDK